MNWFRLSEQEPLPNKFVWAYTQDGKMYLLFVNGITNGAAFSTNVYQIYQKDEPCYLNHQIIEFWKYADIDPRSLKEEIEKELSNCDHAIIHVIEKKRLDGGV
jgi:hypothetical protein